MIREWTGLVGGTGVLALLELVYSAAVRALGLTGSCHIQIHLGVAVPKLHVSLGVGAIHPAFRVEVLGEKFNG
jgi:hypothetical protein